MPKRSRPQSENSRFHFTLTALVVIVSVGTLAYSNSLTGPFVFDDTDEISENPHVQVTALDWDEFRDAAWRSPSSKRPLANVTFALNYYAGGLRTVGYHVVNVVIHLACGVLVYFLGLATFSRANAQRDQARTPTAVEWMSLLAALCFVSHPLQVQAVTYIVQRMTSLATLFYLGALLLYIRGRTATTPRHRWFLWGFAGVCWLGALGSKEIAITWPMAVLLYEWFLFQDLSREWLKKSSRVLVPLGLLLIVAIFVRASQIGEYFFGTYLLRDFTMGERVLTEFRVLVYYLSLVIWPLPGRLSLTHDIAISHGLFDPVTTLLSLVLLVGLMVFAVWAARRYRLVSFCLCWFFLQLALESTVIPLELAYEHRMYLPMVGLSLLTGWALFAYLPDVKKPVAVGAAIVMLLAMATHARNETWQDARTLWSDVVAKNPQDARAHNDLGRILAQRGDFARSLRHLRQAIELNADYAEAYYNIAVTRAVQGNLTEAEANYRKAFEVQPTYFPAYNNLGTLLASQGKEAEAIEYFRKAVEINAEFAPAHNNLGNALASQGQTAEAMEHYHRALEIEPRIVDTHYSLGVLLSDSGKVVEAEQHFRQALALALAQGQGSFAKQIEAALRALPPANPSTAQ